MVIDILYAVSASLLLTGLSFSMPAAVLISVAIMLNLLYLLRLRFGGDSLVVFKVYSRVSIYLSNLGLADIFYMPNNLKTRAQQDDWRVNRIAKIIEHEYVHVAISSCNIGYDEKSRAGEEEVLNNIIGLA